MDIGKNSVAVITFTSGALCTRSCYAHCALCRLNWYSQGCHGPSRLPDALLSLDVATVLAFVSRFQLSVLTDRFGIGASDRFSMCSGIAHDPLQRDIFTPLFFGARVIIPTDQDIAEPVSSSL